MLYPRLPGCASTRGQSPSKVHWSYACSHLVCKRPGPQYAVCSGSCELSRHLVVKIITVFCTSSCHDYRVPLSRAHTLYNQLLALFLAETRGMGSCCLLPAWLCLPLSLATIASLANTGQIHMGTTRWVGDIGVQNKN